MSNDTLRHVRQVARSIFIGDARNPEDPHIFHKLTLVAFFAWVGLGADGLSSSCYGPEEAFRALGSHFYLGLFVALGSVLTIFVISASYSQIIELFPHGGGGYLVASRLLSPKVGMISGSALLIDYVLTITLSVASGADALFSFLPASWYTLRLPFAVAVLGLLILLNLRGVKESVAPLVPIFLTFLLTHAFAIFYGLFTHLANFSELAQTTLLDVRRSHAELGMLGMILLVLRAYSMGAGTYTGIEAVSNGMPILREPKVRTAKTTMRYMAFSLAFMVMGLMIGYMLFRVEHLPGKTLNAILLEQMVSGWPHWAGLTFVLVTLFSEAVLLIVAAQTGFLDGPRVLANMALDRWLPSRFASLSDRLVTQNGILIMGGASLILMVLSKGSVRLMVVLYSINVFITFFLSQLGMVRHWWQVRRSERRWLQKLTINGIGMVLTGFILISVATLKFDEGGWITLVVTGALVSVALLVKRHYIRTGNELKRLDSLVDSVELSLSHREDAVKRPRRKPIRSARTAVLLTSGYNGLGLHTLFGTMKLLGKEFRNFIFVQVGVVDAGAFRSPEEMAELRAHVKGDLDRYVHYMQSQGYYAESIPLIGIDVVEEIVREAPLIQERFPGAVFCGGQLVFPTEPMFSRWLHNYTVFSLQRRFYYLGLPVVLLPIRV
ncbi:MAG TPA: amino acid permease [bacterium]|nr:amino acid permease [bacterium]HQG46011.1 amino acid permease [bacterium]HQJ65021.1 amino acid permease [bacterium]